MHHHKSKWAIPLTKQAFPTMRLFCFPYSGGSAQIYKDWGNFLPSSVQVCGVQYPGRGSRFSEKPCASMDVLQTEMIQDMRHLFNLPFAFFGHSLGAAIAFECTHRLAKEGLRPKILIVSGRNAPNLPRKTEPLYNLPEAEFREKLRTLGGTSPEVLAHPELMDLVAPLVRADFTLSETFKGDQFGPVSCPLAAFGGDADPLVDEAGIRAWEKYGTPFTAEILEGDHFFLDSNRETLVRRVASLIS